MNTKTPSQLLALALFAASSANGAITLSSTAPTMDGADQGNMTWVTTNSELVWTDRPNRGQTFTTEANPLGYTLSSFSIQLNSNRTNDQAMTFSFRVVSVSGTDTTTLVNQTGDVWSPTPHTAGDWLTFTFDSPVSLAPDATYGIDFQHTAGGSWQSGITAWRRNGNTFLGGNAYTRDDGDPTTIGNNSNDHIFHVDMVATPIPEPTAAFLGGLGLLGLLRRRR